jgi:1-acyl-sn-glycerol-3-phosphate acyltransferase
MASHLQLPVIPIRLTGLDLLWHRTARRPHRGTAEVSFGPAVRWTGESYSALGQKLEDIIRNL